MDQVLTNPSPAETADPPPSRSALLRWWPWGLAIVAAGAAAWSWVRWNRAAAVEPVYRTAVVQRGDILQTVSASGPLSAVSTVNVGSQVSGNIATMHVDFNDTVRVGQVIAEIEPSSYEAALAQAQADLASAQAALELKQVNADRAALLFSQRMIPQADNDQAQAELHQAAAALRGREAALKTATINLGRTSIRSPIDGTVIDRTVDVGQTVQASFAAPTLFVLAQDLRKMQITANVSEADVGLVAVGQPVDFTVDAFPGQTFTGQVTQVRNNSTITNNVVTYATIVTVDNPDLRLRPGMTANVLVRTAQRSNVLRVPNGALRFHPDAAEAAGPEAAGGHAVYAVRGHHLDGNRFAGPVERIAVQVGLSDGTWTELTAGATEGLPVATGVAIAAAANADTTNPFMPRLPTSRGAGR